jgi:hypothetical protein
MTLALPVPAVVLAPCWDSYPPLVSTSEVVLLPVVRVERCACGELIRQLAGDAVALTVGRHNARPTHRAWRERRG